VIGDDHAQRYPSIHPPRRRLIAWSLPLGGLAGYAAGSILAGAVALTPNLAKADYACFREDPDELPCWCDNSTDCADLKKDCDGDLDGDWTCTEGCPNGGCCDGHCT
jgi:hypothetical protein